MTNKLYFRPRKDADEADFENVANLINLCSAEDGLDDLISKKDIQEFYGEPQFDLARDLRLWQDQSDRLVAIAELWHYPPQIEEIHQVLGELVFEIHPQVRDDGLEEEILIWAEQRLREVGRGISLPLVLDSPSSDRVSQRKAILARLGFVPERCFLNLKRSLEEPILEQPVPVGWKIRMVNPENDGEAWVEMYNQSFVDFWEHNPLTLENFYYDTSLSDYDRDLNFVMETDKGELVTFCTIDINLNRNRRKGSKEGRVLSLGTRRGYRRRGLARTLLMFGLKRLQSLGMQAATVCGVDDLNPSGAFTLYQSLGFIEDSRKIIYRKKVTAANV